MKLKISESKYLDAYLDSHEWDFFQATQENTHGVGPRLFLPALPLDSMSAISQHPSLALLQQHAPKQRDAGERRTWWGDYSSVPEPDRNLLCPRVAIRRWIVIGHEHPPQVPPNKWPVPFVYA
jgi:hypothetical protein